MAIKLSSLVSEKRRYFQVETQPHHVIGIFKKLSYYNNVHKDEFLDENCISYECQEDGTITFYQIEELDTNAGKIWTYVTYDCPEGEEGIFPDSSAYTNTDALNKLISGEKIVVIASDLYEYVQYKINNHRYLNVELSVAWYTHSRREIAISFIEEVTALTNCHIFMSHPTGRDYVWNVLQKLINTANEVIERGGNLTDFESLKFPVINQVNAEPVAKLIMEQNDYRIWQSAMPSKSRAVEYAFNTALELISRAN